jgi:hypothetical protein
VRARINAAHDGEILIGYESDRTSAHARTSSNGEHRGLSDDNRSCVNDAQIGAAL